MRPRCCPWQPMARYGFLHPEGGRRGYSEGDPGSRHPLRGLPALPSDASWHPGRVATGGPAVTVSVSSVRFTLWWPRITGVDVELYCAELSFDELMLAKGPDPSMSSAQVPAVTRDIAVVCDEAVTVKGPWSRQSGEEPGSAEGGLPL